MMINLSLLPDPFWHCNILLTTEGGSKGRVGRRVGVSKRSVGASPGWYNMEVGSTDYQRWKDTKECFIIVLNAIAPIPNSTCIFTRNSRNRDEIFNMEKFWVWNTFFLVTFTWYCSFHPWYCKLLLHEYQNAARLHLKGRQHSGRCKRNCPSSTDVLTAVIETGWS